jgi:ABC-2 type transport system ATP-binding protein
MIRTENLCKSYGSQPVLDNINLNIEKGQTYCLLGKNGVGKSTLLNIMLDLIKPDSGAVLLMEKNAQNLDKEFKMKIGAAGDQLPLIDEITGKEFLTFIGKLYSIPREILEKRINDLFEYFFENESDLKKNISKYSTGMRRKIAFCAAVIHTPDILILDEPFSGLDPLVADQMITFIKKYQNGERAVLISSHDLSYIEKLATHICVLDSTHLVFDSTIAEFTESGVNKLDAALLKLLKPANSELQKIDWL